MAPVAHHCRRSDRPCRCAVLGCDRLHARDREAREPAHSAPSGTGARGCGAAQVGVNQTRHKPRPFPHQQAAAAVTSCGSWAGMLAPMEPSRPAFHPAGAGTLLAGTTAPCIGGGAPVGWAAGSVGYGILAGAMVGIPAGVGAVYVKYKDSM